MNTNPTISGDIVDRLLKEAPHREAEAKAEIIRLRLEVQRLERILGDHAHAE